MLMRFGWAFALLAFGLIGCADKRGGNIPYDVANFRPPDPASDQVLGEDYRILPLDEIKVSVFNVPDLTRQYSVDLTGSIGLPLIGNVRAAGKTTDELAQDLKVQLGKKYLNNPDITVAVVESKKSSLTVEGAVNRPGVFPVLGSTNLLQAVALAQGTDGSANPRRVAIFRQIDGQQMAAAFDLTSIRRGEADNPALYAGDIVVVDGSSIKSARRDILQTLPIIGLFTRVF